MQQWQVVDSKEIYNIDHWGDGFFDINAQGHVVVYPSRTDRFPAVDLYDLVDRLKAENFTLPVLVRFPHILNERISSLCASFYTSIREANYKGKYAAVYPIKANQQSYVASEIVNHPNGVGLEAGSKPELLAVLALAEKQETIIICNGYKDSEYIRLALLSLKLGHRVYIILEKISELDIVLREARKLDVKPLLGIRVRSGSVSAGKWQKTGGEKSKFGLTAGQVLKVVERLRAEKSLDILQLLHFHFGSQIANIGHIQNGIRECARYYAELRALGAEIQVVDVGGGLGVDYDGTHTRKFSSMNYSMQEYANNIVYTLLDTCNALNLPHPNIITESGRAMTAHHAVLITNVIDQEAISLEDNLDEVDNNDKEIILKNFRDNLASLTTRTAIEAYHDACYWMQEAHSKYIHGILTLTQRAKIERLYVMTCWQVRKLLKPEVQAHRELLDELNEKLADKFFINFSLFQSLPDAWAIDQVFPILPLSNLDKMPDRRAILQDLTCDSDGAIDYYVDGQGLETTLPLPSFDPQEPYFMGIFLVGAYQEILGDMHNLFGDTDSVNVVLNPDGSYSLSQPEPGDLVKDVLQYVHYDCDKLIESYRKQLANSKLPAHQAEEYLNELIAGLHGYTYLED